MSGATYLITTALKDRSRIVGPSEARAVVDALLWLRRNGRIHLFAFVVMPDHAHALFQTAGGRLVSEVVGTWKEYSAKAINRLRAETGPFWQPGFHDRAIRDEEELLTALAYVVANPVRNGLVERAQDFRWSSAHPEWAGEIDPLL